MPRGGSFRLCPGALPCGAETQSIQGATTATVPVNEADRGNARAAFPAAVNARHHRAAAPERRGEFRTELVAWLPIDLPAKPVS